MAIREWHYEKVEQMHESYRRLILLLWKSIEETKKVILLDRGGGIKTVSSFTHRILIKINTLTVF